MIHQFLHKTSFFVFEGDTTYYGNWNGLALFWTPKPQNLNVLKSTNNVSSTTTTSLPHTHSQMELPWYIKPYSIVQKNSPLLLSPFSSFNNPTQGTLFIFSHLYPFILSIDIDW